MNLFAISQQIKAIEQVIEENGGEFPDDLAAQLDAVECERKTKLQGLAAWYLNIMARASAVAEQERRLQMMRRDLEAKAQRLLDYVSAGLNDGEKVEFDFATIKATKGEKVELLCDEEAVPLEYTRVKTEIDKTAIKQGLKSGAAIDFARIVKTRGATIK